MIICIDSQVIIWGIKQQSNDGQEGMVARAEAFFEWADENEHEIIIPTVVLAEVLASEPDNVRARFLSILNESFLLADFDTRAALKYAEILHGRFTEIKEIASGNSVARQRMKVDHMIIATAIVNNAACIYSYDNGLASFANGYIDVRHFPPPPARQPELFPNLTTA